MYYQEVMFGKDRLRGYLHHSDSNNKLVVMLHGFTGNKNDNHFMFRSYARSIHQMGYDVARFDFLGSGDSDNEFDVISIHSQVKQCHAIINLYQEAYEEIHLFGFSLGGVIASNYASLFPSRIDSLFLLYPAFNFVEILDGMLNQAKRIENGFDMNGFIITDRFIEEVKNFNYTKNIGCYKNRVKVLIGTEDQFIPKEVVEEAVKEYEQEVQYVELEHADHCYTSVELSEQVIVELQKFYRRK